jgi:hypothetical protein
MPELILFLENYYEYKYFLDWETILLSELDKLDISYQKKLKVSVFSSQSSYQSAYVKLISAALPNFANVNKNVHVTYFMEGSEDFTTLFKQVADFNKLLTSINQPIYSCTEPSLLFKNCLFDTRSAETKSNKELDQSTDVKILEKLTKEELSKMILQIPLNWTSGFTISLLESRKLSPLEIFNIAKQLIIKNEYDENEKMRGMLILKKLVDKGMSDVFLPIAELISSLLDSKISSDVAELVFETLIVLPEWGSEPEKKLKKITSFYLRNVNMRHNLSLQDLIFSYVHFKATKTAISAKVKQVLKVFDATNDVEFQFELLRGLSFSSRVHEYIYDEETSFLLVSYWENFLTDNWKNLSENFYVSEHYYESLIPSHFTKEVWGQSLFRLSNNILWSSYQQDEDLEMFAKFLLQYSDTTTDTQRTFENLILTSDLKMIKTVLQSHNRPVDAKIPLPKFAANAVIDRVYARVLNEEQLEVYKLLLGELVSNDYGYKDEIRSRFSDLENYFDGLGDTENLRNRYGPKITDLIVEIRRNLSILKI